MPAAQSHRPITPLPPLTHPPPTHHHTLLDNNIVPKMPQYQRKKRQKATQRKCQIRKNHIPKHTPMLILDKRQKHE